MKLSNSKIKKFLIISQKKAFLIFSQKAPHTFWPQSPKACSEKISYSSNFLETEISKKSLCFRKQNFIVFWEVTFQDQKNFILFLIKKQNFIN